MLARPKGHSSTCGGQEAIGQGCHLRNCAEWGMHSAAAVLGLGGGGLGQLLRTCHSTAAACSCCMPGWCWATAPAWPAPCATFTLCQVPTPRPHLAAQAGTEHGETRWCTGQALGSVIHLPQWEQKQGLTPHAHVCRLRSSRAAAAVGPVGPVAAISRPC